MRLPHVRFTARRLVAPVAIVLAVGISLAIAFLVATARDMAARVECQNHVVQIGLMLQNYVSSKGRFPPGAIPDPSLPLEKRWSWIAAGLPYIEANAPYIPDRSKPWDDEANRSLLAHDFDDDKRPRGVSKLERDDWGVFLCPCGSRRTDPAGHGLTNYVGIAGVGRDAPWLPAEDPKAGLFGYREGTRPEQIKDGLSTTMAIIETGSTNGPWRAAGPSTIRGLDGTRRPYLGKARQFGGLHRGGAFVGFADGSVRFVRERIEPEVFEALSTIAGGEQLSTGWDP